MQRQRVIAFYPELANKLGDALSAIFYQQIWYWGDKGDREDGFIYKTKDEIEFETTLSRDQQDRIRKKLVKIGWLSVKKEKINGAPTLLYKALMSVDVVIGKAGNPLMEKWETHHSSIHRLHTKKREFSKENSHLSSKVKPIKLNEEGEEIEEISPRKKADPVVKRVNTKFREMSDNYIGAVSPLQIGKHGAIIKSALKVLSEKEIYDLFEWWFEDSPRDKEDYDLIQITQALSGYNISRYKSVFK